MNNIPDLSFEKLGDGLILLQQDSGGNLDRVAIHPVHLRHLAEKFGLVESSDLQAQRTIDTLRRRLLLLRDRVHYLASWLVNHSDSKHADLSYEQTYANATADIAEEFCAELESVAAAQHETT